ncbi:hypothetical protein C0J52_18726 [Blattella germanica]|nr:hypothetical protein C0J52_18726 [Blattella germanica]
MLSTKHKLPLRKIPKIFREDNLKMALRSGFMSVTCHAIRSKSSAAAQSINLSGIMPPIPTPFNEDESIAYAKLSSNFQHWEKMPFQGYVVQGSNGEYPLLTTEERIEMVKQVRQLIPKDKLLIAGSSSESTQATIDITNEMAAVGANAVMVINPSYFKSSMTNSALIKHYEDVANNSSVPWMNKLKETGSVLKGKTTGRPRVSDECVEEVRDEFVRSPIFIFKVTGVNETNLIYAENARTDISTGCVGGINGLANILGNEVCEIHRLVSESRLREALELHQRLIVPNALVTRELGVPAMKAAMDMVGLYGGPCRRPLLPLTDQERKRVQQAFNNSGFETKY